MAIISPGEPSSAGNHPTAWHSCVTQSDDFDLYKASQTAEFNGILDRNVFRVLTFTDADGYRIYDSRFVDEVKNTCTTNANAKWRLVVMAFNDRKHGLLTGAPTVQRAFQHLIIAIYGTNDTFHIVLRDVTKAYSQSETTVSRPMFVRPPSVFNTPPEMLFRVHRPLYGLPESGVHWFVTYHNHPRRRLSMHAAVHDHCLLYTPGCLSISAASSVPRGMTALRTDDTLHIGNKKYLDNEEAVSSKYKRDPKTILLSGGQLKFNDGFIALSDDCTVTLQQPQRVENLAPVSDTEQNHATFIAEQARDAYFSSISRSDLSYGFAVSSQVTTVDSPSAKRLNKFIANAKKERELVLTFVPPDFDSVRLPVFADAGFASNADLTSQLGFVMCLVKKHKRANIVHYSSFKAKRITRSVLAAELFALVYAFDYASTL